MHFYFRSGSTFREENDSHVTSDLNKLLFADALQKMSQDVGDFELLSIDREHLNLYKNFSFSQALKSQKTGNQNIGL